MRVLYLSIEDRISQKVNSYLISELKKRIPFRIQQIAKVDKNDFDEYDLVLVDEEKLDLIQAVELQSSPIIVITRKPDISKALALIESGVIDVIDTNHEKFHTQLRKSVVKTLQIIRKLKQLKQIENQRNLSLKVLFLLGSIMTLLSILVLKF